MRVHFHHAAHLAPILRRNARGINAHRFHIVRIDFRAEARRAVVRQRNAVHHKLCLIFRAARMQHRVAFIEPARLRIHQILHRSPRQRTHTMLNRVRPDLIDLSRLVRIHQRLIRRHIHRLLHLRQLQLQRDVLRELGLDLHGLRRRRKAELRHRYFILSKRQPLHIHRALVRSRQRFVVLVPSLTIRPSSSPPIRMGRSPLLAALLYSLGRTQVPRQE